MKTIITVPYCGTITGRFTAGIVDHGIDEDHPPHFKDPD
jgi:hypothetical protein